MSTTVIQNAVDNRLETIWTQLISLKANDSNGHNKLSVMFIFREIEGYGHIFEKDKCNLWLRISTIYLEDKL